MINFNEQHIIAGYIKQLLTSINLPNTAGDGWAGVNQPAYYDNKKILNYQRNYKGFSNIYDSYTHEVLGDYLRFYEWKTGINLMSLYNCFSNVLCDDLEITVSNGKVIKSDNKHKIYMIPVKLGKEYTIAVDEPNVVEVCCGLYDSYQLEAGGNLPALTYKKISGCRFNQPFVYSILKPTEATNADAEQTARDNAIRASVGSFGDNLKLFIILPENNNSSITVLEGNYLGYNDRMLIHQANGTYKNTNNYNIINMLPEEPYVDYADIKYITNLQLLRFNTGKSYPFADRLMEYLTDNVISGADEIRDNVIRVQTVLSKEFTMAPNTQGQLVKKTFDFGKPGLWTDKIKAFAYTKMQELNSNTFDRNHDILGYIDKDVEATYSVIESDNDGHFKRVDADGNAVCKQSDGTWPRRSHWKTISLNGVDIYPDIYKDSKGGE